MTNQKKIWQVTEDGLLFDIEINEELQKVALESLEQEGFIFQRLMTWDSLYAFIKENGEGLGDAEANVTRILELPTVADVVMSLRSYNALSDKDFSIGIDWLDSQGKSISLGARKGPFCNGKVLPENLWRILQLNTEFNQRKRVEPGKNTNQFYWGRIRAEAKKGNVKLDHFLTRTHVVSPQQLRINVNEEAIQDRTKKLVSIDFDGLPKGWEEIYERTTEIKPYYSVLEPDGGLVHVVLDERVRSVLKKIRESTDYGVDEDTRINVALNPWAYLDENERGVLSEDSDDVPQIVLYEPLVVVMNKGDAIDYLLIHLEPIGESGKPSKTQEIHSSDKWRNFVDRSKKAQTLGNPVINWRGVPVSVSMLTEKQTEEFDSLCTRWEKQEVGQLERQALDLTEYGDRVIGFGEFVAKKIPDLLPPEPNRWISEATLNEAFGEIAGESFATYGTAELESLEAELSKKEKTKEDVILPKSQVPVPYEIAALLAEKLRSSILPKPKEESSQQEKKTKKGLLTETELENIPESECFKEGSKEPEIPHALRPEITLRLHQKNGVAKLQWLYEKSLHSPHIKGCLLADDMGLGKTLQLLVFIINLLEKDSKEDPALVVAPLALLLNWQEEIDRFFNVDFGILTLYGEAVQDLTVSRHKLQGTELRDYRPQLKSDWIGGNRIVLTTYETLRNYQMPLARAHFSVVVCDEAQKIKNPNTIVHSAAIALQAKFKVSCTGTPVENSLVDLWSVFDFCNPHWLPGVSRFCRLYVNSENRNLEELQKKIDPLTLHRTKAECIRELPEKIEDEDCQYIPMSSYQYEVYAKLIASFKSQTESGAVLALLGKLKLACAHPNLASGQWENFQDIDQSPKVAWLLKTLKKIRSREEKVIIFTEVRDLQVVLASVIRKKLGVPVSIVNGSVAVKLKAAASEESREGLIRAFRKTRGFAVIILSGLAVGFGVNIQEANHVIHFTRLWNPAKEDQATDRVYRIGQKKTVHVYYPTVCIPDEDKYGILRSFDEVINGVLTRKRRIAHKMLDGIGKDVTEEVLAGLRAVK